MVRTTIFVMLALFTAACRESPSAPAPPSVQLEVLGAAVIHVAADGPPISLQVTARDASSGELMENVEVDWSVTGGPAQLESARSITDEYGVARVRVSSAALGASSVKASTGRISGGAPVFEVNTVPRGEIEAVDPAVVAPGQELVITGWNFSPVATENVVLFDGVRGTVLTATSTRLTVRAPACMPSRRINVEAGIGYALSSAVTLLTTGNDGGAIHLEPAGIRTLTTASELSCIQIPHSQEAAYLLIVQNSFDMPAPPRAFQLHALGTTPHVANEPSPASGQTFASAWESRLRDRERTLPPGPDLPPASVQATETKVGDSRSFNVVNASNEFDRITATARVVTRHAIIYVDDEAASAFPGSDLTELGALFDDPIHAIVTGAFGSPSDVDGNGRVMMLFTPRVNALTPRASSTFVAGFFYGCDLVSRSRCSGTNRGEVFYSMVPDLSGKWGDARSLATVKAAVPSVLAHEFQHMIHFARRGFSSDVLWLAEGLAHTAEELVGDQLHEDGELPLSQLFYQGNYGRARDYLRDIDDVSLVSEDSPGTLSLRGGAWLFLKYLRGHYGGDGMLGRLTATKLTGAANLQAVVPRAWEDLLTDFAIALWVSGTPTAAAVGERHRFADFNPRAALAPDFGQFYPLRPRFRLWNDFAQSITLPSASLAYTWVGTEDGTAGALNLVLSGWQGAPIDAEGVRLTVLRVR